MKKLIKLGDYAGIAASALCLAHCVAGPLLVLAFPLGIVGTLAPRLAGLRHPPGGRCPAGPATPDARGDA